MGKQCLYNYNVTFDCRLNMIMTKKTMNRRRRFRETDGRREPISSMKDAQSRWKALDPVRAVSKSRTSRKRARYIFARVRASRSFPKFNHSYPKFSLQYVFCPHTPDDRNPYKKDAPDEDGSWRRGRLRTKSFARERR
jgi:hypothetical protein